MNIIYYWSRIIRKLSGKAISNSHFEKPSKVEAQSTVINTTMGYYSYCGYNCLIVNAEIGRFCSISDNVTIGAENHPQNWVSTSPAFYYGRDSIPKNLASLKFDSKLEETVIGNDVWIGRGSFIKGGIKVGDGAIIGMGSIVTKDVPPYAIVAGNPARIIKYRFSADHIDRLKEIEWWARPLEILKKQSDCFDNIETFLEEYSSKRDIDY